MAVITVSRTPRPRPRVFLLGLPSAGIAFIPAFPFRRPGRSGPRFPSRFSVSPRVMERDRSMSRRDSISAGLLAHRASILRDGRRCFYVIPSDLDARSRLSRCPHSDFSACLRSAYDWLSRVRSSGSWPFLIVERAELNGMSVTASYREILVFSDLFPALKREGCTFDKGERDAAQAAFPSLPLSGASGASQARATIKAKEEF